jgi:hypothetical protein
MRRRCEGTHWERVSKEYRLEINLEKTVSIKLSRNGEKTQYHSENKQKRNKRSSKFILLREVWWRKKR